MSSVSSVSSSQQYIPNISTQSIKRDADGDNDGTKTGNVEAKQPPKPVSATIGNNINTTA